MCRCGSSGCFVWWSLITTLVFLPFLTSSASLMNKIPPQPPPLLPLFCLCLLFYLWISRLFLSAVTFSHLCDNLPILSCHSVFISSPFFLSSPLFILHSRSLIVFYHSAQATLKLSPKCRGKILFEYLIMEIPCWTLCLTVTEIKSNKIKGFFYSRRKKISLMLSFVTHFWLKCYIKKYDCVFFNCFHTFFLLKPVTFSFGIVHLE